jgi:hypothetical protein
MSLKLLSSTRLTGPRVLSKHRATFVAVASFSTNETVNRQGLKSFRLEGNSRQWHVLKPQQFHWWDQEILNSRRDWLREMEERWRKVSLRSSRVSPSKSDDPFFQLTVYKGRDYQMGPLWRGRWSKCRAAPKILVSSFTTKGRRRIACFPRANLAFVAIPQVCWAWTSHT